MEVVIDDKRFYPSWNSKPVKEKYNFLFRTLNHPFFPPERRRRRMEFRLTPVDLLPK